ncbi:MAG: HAD family hydrolase [Oscillospiraceae bacterium]|nr:HAD family hydrolase [Oscillospiraceae bacterium]
MRYTTVIFDLDGTLLNTLEDIKDSVNATMRHFGYAERRLDEIRAFVGNGAGNLIARCLPGGRDEPGFDDILAWYDGYYTEHSLIKTAPYPGIIDLLRELNRREFKLAVVSNKQDPVVKTLARKFFSGLISVAVGESAGVARKPAPDSVLSAMRELWSEPFECVYVGDSEVDIATARAAGIPCISVSWGFRSRELLKDHGAATIISKPSELLKEL